MAAPAMKFGEKYDMYADEHGTYLVDCIINREKVRYDDLLHAFGKFGRIATIVQCGDLASIRYEKKHEALLCFAGMYYSKDFTVDIPLKFKISRDVLCSIDDYINLFTDEADGPQDAASVSDGPAVRFVCRKRKFIRCPVFNRFLLAVSRLEQYLCIDKSRRNVISEVRRNLTDSNPHLDTEFEAEVEDIFEEDVHPQLILAQDLFFFETAIARDSVDLVICSLPPSFQQVHAYRLVLPFVGEDLLRIDWHLRYTPGSEDVTFPSAIVHLKTRRAASHLQNAIHDMEIEQHNLSVFLLEDVKEMLIEATNTEYLLTQAHGLSSNTNCPKSAQFPDQQLES